MPRFSSKHWIQFKKQKKNIGESPTNSQLCKVYNIKKNINALIEEIEILDINIDIEIKKGLKYKSIINMSYKKFWTKNDVSNYISDLNKWKDELSNILEKEFL